MRKIDKNLKEKLGILLEENLRKEIEDRKKNKTNFKRKKKIIKQNNEKESLVICENGSNSNLEKKQNNEKEPLAICENVYNTNLEKKQNNIEIALEKENVSKIKKKMKKKVSISRKICNILKENINISANDLIVLLNGYPQLEVKKIIESNQLNDHIKQREFILKMEINKIQSNLSKYSESEKEEKVEEIKKLKNKLKKIKNMNLQKKEKENSFKNLLGCVDDKKEESLLEFLTDFNSNRYGNILDQLYKLQDENTENLDYKYLHLILKAIFIFLKKKGISPLYELNKEILLNLEEIKEDVLLGNHFKNYEEVKKVIVVNPGWQYKNIKFSKITYKEVD